MTARTKKKQEVLEMFPGMPDLLPKAPPKAVSGEHVARTLDEAIARSHEILDQALAEHTIVVTISLFSGGNDSVIASHLLRGRVNAIAHVNTGTGIPATTTHVRDVTAAWNLPLHELHPRDSYEDLVLGRVIARTGPNAGKRQVWKGFPGPAGHRVMYRRLKDEPLMRLRAQLLDSRPRSAKVAYLGGMRWAETQRRFRNAEAIDVQGRLVWVSPLVHWTDAHMREYRARHRCQQDHEHANHRLCTPDALPLNEVTEHLHMSGECLCGAYAKPGELDEIEFFYPETAARLRALEEQAEQAGLLACRWGRKPPTGTASESGPAGRLCSSCPGTSASGDDSDTLLDAWRDAGLITTQQHANFLRPGDAA
ncbi:hypothetical protein CP967_08365 [Streptomyces nitrosporeus]|uniref:Phosphoadenosine phosphosulphate reductase domain-containing protein n=1 Tax=Streptomyces nitrosporeus TaxID=28894 RepID=A0A5J6F6M9_9ACTN|nr:hypothetical protein [Streptomyces nitrosporeus]QEU71979.1 hypothetical protein CP967_08365 [Streptomyces nitrosporeus]